MRYSMCLYLMKHKSNSNFRKKNENEKNFFYGKINDFGEPFCVSQPSLLAHIH